MSTTDSGSSIFGSVYITPDWEFKNAYSSISTVWLRSRVICHENGAYSEVNSLHVQLAWADLTRHNVNWIKIKFEVLFWILKKKTDHPFPLPKSKNCTKRSY